MPFPIPSKKSKKVKETYNSTPEENTITNLREENRRLRKRVRNADPTPDDTTELRREIRRLKRENYRLREELESLRLETSPEEPEEERTFDPGMYYGLDNNEDA